ncbi:hypothetical protein GGS23DRAFT_565466 [Durotheca rogersii]|uniref:uncharacterized protein n=1 Tax=Durotheca rogersii TaxID=419775 RepID=UPI00221EFD42|nr:uncharacterized protein GGS23DRAFT_565466 [Durotheca rogersii]KAI5863802.1 hypothetical protein GGS23DRAFT_565466 [Durotheca rogersii]
MSPPPRSKEKIRATGPRLAPRPSRVRPRPRLASAQFSPNGAPGPAAIVGRQISLPRPTRTAQPGRLDWARAGRTQGRQLASCPWHIRTYLLAPAPGLRARKTEKADSRAARPAQRVALCAAADTKGERGVSGGHLPGRKTRERTSGARKDMGCDRRALNLKISRPQGGGSGVPRLSGLSARAALLIAASFFLPALGVGPGSSTARSRQCQRSPLGSLSRSLSKKKDGVCVRMLRLHASISGSRCLGMPAYLRSYICYPRPASPADADLPDLAKISLALRSRRSPRPPPADLSVSRLSRASPSCFVGGPSPPQPAGRSLPIFSSPLAAAVSICKSTTIGSMGGRAGCLPVGRYSSSKRDARTRGVEGGEWTCSLQGAPPPISARVPCPDS